MFFLLDISAFKEECIILNDYIMKTQLSNVTHVTCYVIIQTVNNEYKIFKL